MKIRQFELVVRRSLLVGRRARACGPISCRLAGAERPHATRSAPAPLYESMMNGGTSGWLAGWLGAAWEPNAIRFAAAASSEQSVVEDATAASSTCASNHKPFESQAERSFVSAASTVDERLWRRRNEWANRRANQPEAGDGEESERFNLAPLSIHFI